MACSSTGSFRAEYAEEWFHFLDSRGREHSLQASKRLLEGLPVTATVAAAVAVATKCSWKASLSRLSAESEVARWRRRAPD